MGGELVHHPAQRRSGPDDESHTEQLEQSREVDPHPFSHIAGEIDSEHRLRDDIHGQIIHLGGDVHRLTLCVQLIPAGNGARGSLCHLRREQINLPLGENGLHQPSIAIPQSLIEVGDQSAAESHCQEIVFGTLDVVVLIGNQYMPGQFRIADDGCLPHGCPGDDDVVLTREISKVLRNGVSVGGPNRPECQPP
ncbi:Uncharacterised protein [Mycobacteroides abscessus subsp. abscessus]|nr:Uncharacterised protein [Mycobacteroides abscessus subsp. abscessus]